MSSRGIHIPGIPVTLEPPSKLVEIADSITAPAITRVGLTTTANGEWALMVHVRQGTRTPIKKIEKVCSDYPIIYQEEPEDLPVARPAYPSRGE